MIFFWADPKRSRYVIGNEQVTRPRFRAALKQALALAVTYRRISGDGKLGYKINTIYDAREGAVSRPYPKESGWMHKVASTNRETINLLGVPSLQLQQFLRTH